MPFQVLILDDHKASRDAIKTLLRRSEEFRVVGEADCSARAVETCVSTRADIVLLDMGLAGWNGSRTVGDLKRHCPKTKIIVLSMYDDERVLANAIGSGAQALVLKKPSERDLLDAFHAVVKDATFISPELSDRISARLYSKPTPHNIDSLSTREVEVLRLVADGQTSKQIAGTLNLALQTIRSYRRAVMRKLAVKDIAELRGMFFVFRCRSRDHGAKS